MVLSQKQPEGLSVQYFFANGDNRLGPFPLEALAAQGLKRDSLVWREGMSQWEQADTLAELAAVVQGLPASPSYIASAAPAVAPGAQPGPAYGAAAYSPAGTPAGLAYQTAYSPQGYYGSAQPPAGMAIASMVLGILSIPMTCAYLIGIPCAIIAIILGHIAVGKARRGEAGGASMAMAGLVCGYISAGLCAVLILIFVIALISNLH